MSGGKPTRRPPYRTVSIAALGILALLAGLAVTGHWPAALGAYPSFAFGVAGCVSAVAVKAWKEHQALAENADHQEAKP